MKNPFELFQSLIREKNPFRDLSREERIQQQLKENEVKEGIKQIAIICNDLLNDQRYKEFANIFKDIEQQLIELMIDCDEPNRDLFYLKIKEYQQKLRIFKNILKVPHEFVARAEEIARTEIEKK